jgi:hypothetical protein
MKSYLKRNVVFFKAEQWVFAVNRCKLSNKQKGGK